LLGEYLYLSFRALDTLEYLKAVFSILAMHVFTPHNKIPYLSTLSAYGDYLGKAMHCLCDRFPQILS
jgi:hypothetical protein